MTAGLRITAGVLFEQQLDGTNETGAIFSPDSRYRYVLWRVWGPRPRRLVVVGLNPSTADAVKNDPTITRCIRFAKRERCDGLIMLNLYAFRSTDPKRLTELSDPVGPDNDKYLREYGRGESIVVAAWGAFPKALWQLRRDRDVTRDLPSMLCFGTTKDGHPRHPLYLKADTPLVPYRKP